MHIVILILCLHDASLDVLRDVRRNAIQESLVLAHESHRVPRLFPPGVGTDLDALRLDLLGQLREVGRDGTFRQGRGDEDADGRLALGVDETRENVGLQTIQQSLNCASVSNAQRSWLEPWGGGGDTDRDEALRAGCGRSRSLQQLGPISLPVGRETASPRGRCRLWGALPS